jgi:formate dehydrogenase
MRPVVVLKASAPEGAIDHAAYVACGGYRLLKRCIAGEIEADMVLQSVGESGLCDAKGPAALQWLRVHRQSGPRAMEVRVGRDEEGYASACGRMLLARNPHRCFEGMLIAAWAVGASSIRLLLVRGGHAGLQALLASELVKLRRHRPYPGMPEIALGCCDAPPAPAHRQQQQQQQQQLQPPEEATQPTPTLRQGVETLYWVPDILDGGAEWFTLHRRRPRLALV